MAPNKKYKDIVKISFFGLLELGNILKPIYSEMIICEAITKNSSFNMIKNW